MAPQKPSSAATTTSGTRILYMVTSMSEFDTGQRNTRKGRDRYQDILVPVVAQAVDSMLAMEYQVDVYLITYYSLQNERLELLRQALPPVVGLQVWEDAAPLGYNYQDTTNNNNQQILQPITRALSRQHRFVIKDKLRHYDMFLAWEDDMLIKGDHVKQYLDMTQELRRLAKKAPISSRTIQKNNNNNNPINHFYGELSKVQLARMIPGYIRVEVVNMDPEEFQLGRAQPSSLLPVSNNNMRKIDPSTCCQRTPRFWHNDKKSPTQVNIEDVYLWESQAFALGLHQMPPSIATSNSSAMLDWVVQQRGVEQSFLPREKVIGEYWVGQNAVVSRPDTGLPQYINNQGGWMATSEQIFSWHRGHCKGLFLPPYEDMDGLKNNVEFWSGGLNLVGMNACQLQRIIPLNPAQFAKHLVYHTSNNKQKSKNLVFTKVQDFWEQLYSATLIANASIPS